MMSKACRLFKTRNSRDVGYMIDGVELTVEFAPTMYLPEGKIGLGRFRL